jgi:hypothetical protein
MVYYARDYRVTDGCPSPCILKNTTFRKLYMFLFSGTRKKWEEATLTYLVSEYLPKRDVLSKYETMAKSSESQ